MIAILREYSQVIERYSIDEAFLHYQPPSQDKANHEKLIMEGAEKIKKRIKKELGFTVNIGIGPNKLLAKMASEFRKPDRIHTLYHEEISEKNVAIRG